ncbi:hypothetical protein IFR05_015950 [Cadophora sp. M221]|nr:hypothetical protein IFR05_015950 [Cadophora sp. M221]
MSFCIPCQSFGAWILTQNVENRIRYYKTSHDQIRKARDEARKDPRLAFQHHADDHELLEAAMAGCPLCGVLQELRSAQLTDRIQSQKADGSEPFKFQLYPSSTDISLHYSSIDNSEPVDLEIYSGYSVSNIWGSKDCHPTHPLLAGMVDWINVQIKDCVGDHKECKQQVKTYVPTRLLHVGQADGSEEPYLVEKDDDMAFVETLHTSLSSGKAKTPVLYATLSHCWGTTAHCKTTKDTLSERKACIPMSSLNRTFADAVTATRVLGLKYLWIDSLCIIQDSVQDWEKESATMCWVYGSAYVNIAATSASDGDAGFLHPRPIVDMCSMKPAAGKTNCLLGNFWIRPKRTYFQYRTRSKLSSRAWCYQEMLLTPRILSFEANRVTVECRLGLTTEGDQRQTLRWSLPTRRGDFSRLVTQPITSDAERRSAFTTWKRIVSEYSRKELTFEEDKLPAISGVASQFGAAIKSRYLAGLWEGDILGGLCWVSYAQDVQVKARTYRAPSWSWASQLSYVYYLTYVSIIWDAEILDSSTDLVSDEYGQVKGGSISLRATVVAGTLTFPPVDPNVGWYDKKNMFSTDNNETGSVSCPIEHLDGQAKSFSGKVQSWMCNLGDGNVLVLEKLDGNLYRRIGYIWGWKDYDWSCGERIVVTII